MEVWKAAILGLVQGFTEFLPISSSGHILLFERILGTDTGGADMFLGIVLHAGTLVAVLIAYAPQLAKIMREQPKTIGLLIMATIPAGLVGLLFSEKIDGMFGQVNRLWIPFAATGGVLLLCRRRIRRGYAIAPIGCKSALTQGMAQAFAVIPGLSRSGATLAAGVFCGLDRREATDFSFLMSIPVIGGAIVVEIYKCIQNPIYVAAISWQSLLVGTLCAAVFGTIGVHWMRKRIQGGSLLGFAIYLFCLAFAVLAANFLLA